MQVVLCSLLSLAASAQFELNHQSAEPQAPWLYNADGDTSLPHANHNRLWGVASGHALLWGSSYIALNQAWYAQYPRSGFHFFNDNREWNQMDKAGHAWTAYQMSRLSAATWQWAGLSARKSAWLGAISGLAYQSIIEIQDGFSAEWGFSWGDMTANTAGSLLFLGQQLAWENQRIQLKLSYWPYQYDPSLIERRNQLFGNSLPERILKDYNSQTYWLSANFKDFLPNSKIPRWLNLAIGYGSEGMLGGFSNQWIDKNGTPHDRSDIVRFRRFFISPDLKLSAIKSRKKWVRTLLQLADMLKIPAPAIEWNGRNGFRLHALYY